MHSRAVEFRLLQLVTNPVGDERRTIALVHWDGREMRFAWNAKDIPRNLQHVKDDIQEVLNAAKSAARPLIGKLHLQAALDDVYPVPQGTGSLLAWGARRVGTTRDPAAHFSELVSVLNLQVPQAHTSGSPARHRGIVSQLHWVGETLIRELGGTRVHTRHQVSGLRSYESPLSWLNGRWHHSFPIDLARASADAVVEKFQQALGKIDVSLPQSDVGVILAVHSESPMIETKLADAEQFIANRFGGRVDCVRAPLRKAGVPEFDWLRDRVVADVTSAPVLRAPDVPTISVSSPAHAPDHEYVRSIG